MNLSSQSSIAIKALLEKALKRYTAKGSQTFITDIYLQPKPETGELVILDDDDEMLSQIQVREWEKEHDENFYASVEQALRAILTELQQSGALDNLNLMKPYSFVLVDDEKETLAELLLMDDGDTLFLNDELLKGLDEELNAFLKDLLEK